MNLGQFQQERAQIIKETLEAALPALTELDWSIQTGDALSRMPVTFVRLKLPGVVPMYIQFTIHKDATTALLVSDQKQSDAVGTNKKQYPNLMMQRNPTTLIVMRDALDNSNHIDFLGWISQALAVWRDVEELANLECEINRDLTLIGLSLEVISVALGEGLTVNFRPVPEGWLMSYGRDGFKLLHLIDPDSIEIGAISYSEKSWKTAQHLADLLEPYTELGQGGLLTFCEAFTKIFARLSPPHYDVTKGLCIEAEG